MGRYTVQYTIDDCLAVIKCTLEAITPSSDEWLDEDEQRGVKSTAAAKLANALVKLVKE